MPKHKMSYILLNGMYEALYLPFGRLGTSLLEALIGET